MAIILIIHTRIQRESNLPSRTVAKVIGFLVIVVSISTVVANLIYSARNTPEPSIKFTPMRVRLDLRGPYSILATEQAAACNKVAITLARKLHPAADFAVFNKNDLETARKQLAKVQPRFTQVFVQPEELDVNFAWSWLKMTSELDDDPFVDTRTGWITGSTPQTTLEFVQRISRSVAERASLRNAVIDDVGPNEQAAPEYFENLPGAFMLSPLGRCLTCRTISHGKSGFTDSRIDSMDDFGLVHFGGHGHPDRVDDGITGDQVSRLKLSPCIVFNGACYTGVTSRWFDLWTPSGKVKEHESTDTFALALLSNNVLAYLAAVHPDHGIPVYQEMEFLAFTGSCLGDVIKNTYDGVILANEGKAYNFSELKNDQPSPKLTPAQIMMSGTAARLLFGDPSLVLNEAIVSPPLAIRIEEQAGVLNVILTVTDPELKCSLTDTYYSDLSKTPNMYNDRALITIPVPPDWKGIGNVEVINVFDAGGKPLKHRLIGFAVEEDQGRRFLHIQTDIESDAFMKSSFRSRGSVVRLRIGKP